MTHPRHPRWIYKVIVAMVLIALAWELLTWLRS
jgi:hypothetical protein